MNHAQGKIRMLSDAAVPQDNTLYAATYVELLPTAKTKGAALLRSYRDAGKNGALQLEIAQRIERPSQFVVLGVWKDKAAFDAHGAAAHAKALGDGLNPLLASPNDERQHNVLAIADAKSAPRNAIVVVTHVDVPPPRKDDVIPLLQELASSSRKEAGNLRFDVWQQTSRPNHFTVVETWTGQKACDAHVATGHTRNFRAKLTPMTGALYDERLYRPLR